MTFVKGKSFLTAVSHFPPKLGDAVRNAAGDRIDELCEIRVRAGKPLVLVFTFGKRYITGAGRLSGFVSGDCVALSAAEVGSVFNSMCAYSVHSHAQSISRGFLSLENGGRVGVYGTAAVADSDVMSVRNISGLNIRISGDFSFSSRDEVRRLYGGGCRNTLICGPPASGKTTALRDIARLLSDEAGLTVAVVDERCEIGGYNVGINTDVLSGYPKSAGIEIAVRTLSPDVIICDEIGGGEAEKICESMNSGVKFIMSVHCSSPAELCSKPIFSPLLQAGAAEACVFIEKYRITKIITAKELGYENSGACRLGSDVRHGGSVCGLQA